MFLNPINDIILDENEKIVDYKDLSNCLVLGVDRRHHDKNGCDYIELNDNEVDDKSKFNSIKKYINGNLYITSDLHLNHKNRNSANFQNIIINNINKKVKMTDCIMFLGDMGKKDDTTQKDYIKGFLSKLNCKNVILVLGNHDILSLNDWYDIGFKYVTDRIETNKYIFTHYPIPCGNKINFHGHIHDEKELWNMPVENHINVYIGNHDNEVYTMKEYLKWFKDGRYTKGMKSVNKKFN